MENYGFIDIYASKGIEYLIVIGFLASFVFFCRYFTARGVSAGIEAARAETAEWFRVPSDVRFHQGHAWMKTEADGLVTVGLDDFSQKLVGAVERVDLPPSGAQLAQGERGWAIAVDGKAVPMLSPVGGEVVAVNPRALRTPDVVNRDPYGAGWLLRVRPARLAADTKGLLAGRLARHWMADTLESLRARSGGSAGLVYQDGGSPVPGIAKALAGDRWEETVRHYLLTD